MEEGWWVGTVHSSLGSTCWESCVPNGDEQRLYPVGFEPNQRHRMKEQTWNRME